MAVLGPDIYQIQEYNNELIKSNINEDENTLAMGIYGYLSDSFSHIMQNNIIVASEYINEMFPTRVKYEKNILDHAMMNNVSDINATPATMQVTMCLLESEVEANLVDNKLVIDRDHPIYIGEYEFHLEYDIILTRSILQNNSIMYTARYDNNRANPISSISSTYLTTPYRQSEGGYKYIFIACQLRQVTYSEVFKKIITSNVITNKSLEFEFGDQLAAFDIKITRGNEIIYITPLLHGSSSAGVDGYYCYYRYIDSSNIRLLFDSNSIIPRLNDEITIFIQGTKGAEGNFEYVDDIITTISSTDGSYSNIPTIIKPLTDSQYGEDRTSVKELKDIVPREALARGSITTTTDLTNYFNTISTDTNKLTFLKKADNQFERLFYSYLLIKNDSGEILPTNTVDLKLLYRDSANSTAHDFDSNENFRCVIKPGTHFKYNKVNNNWSGQRVDPDDLYYFENETDASSENDFIYANPFLIIINTKPLLYVSYYLNIVNKRYPLLTNSDYINEKSDLQFIALTSSWNREYKENKYKLKFQCTQNINEDRGLIQKDESGNPIIDENGNFINPKIRSILVLGEKGNQNFVEGTITNYTEENGMFVYEFEFELVTSDVIDADNNIEIIDIYDAQPTPPVSVKVSNVQQSNVIVNATGSYDIDPGYTETVASWSHIVGNETFTVTHVDSEDELSEWGWAAHMHSNLINFAIEDPEVIISENRERLKVLEIKDECSVSTEKGIGEYVAYGNSNGITKKWQRKFDDQIYTVTYTLADQSWSLELEAQLDLSYASISDIKINNNEYSPMITVANIYNTASVEEVDGVYGFMSNDSTETLWNKVFGSYTYNLIRNKKEDSWYLNRTDDTLLNISASDIDFSSANITITSAFNESGEYVEEAVGVYSEIADNSYYTKWERNVEGNVYIATYNKVDINNRWSLVGPGEETYTNFTYETYTVPTVFVRKVTDSFGQDVIKAMGVYSLYEETDTYIQWKMENIDKTYVLTFNKMAMTYRIESFTHYSKFDIDQTTSNLFKATTPMKIYMLYEDKSVETAHGLTRELKTLIPESYPLSINDYVVSNIYTVNGDNGVEFFFNYTDIISSKVTVNQESMGDGHFKQYLNMVSVPMVRAAYLDEGTQKVNELIDIIQTKKGYIENALLVLEDQFGIDFKFYNTYGPSRTFYIDEKMLDRVDISLSFDIALKAGADTANVSLIKNDIKELIEDLNNTELDLHMSNIITPITNKYITDTLNFIEFSTINGEPTYRQFLSRLPESEVSVNTPPEFINIHHNYKLEDGRMIDDGIGITINSL